MVLRVSGCLLLQIVPTLRAFGGDLRCCLLQMVSALCAFCGVGDAAVTNGDNANALL